LILATRRLQKKIPTPIPNIETAPRAPKNHFWFVTREDRSENQAKSGVEEIVGGLGLAVGDVSDADETVLVNAGAVFSVVTWSLGRGEVGLGCWVILLDDGTMVGL
jgi:hypothetical protein